MPEILRPTNPVPGYDNVSGRQPINPQDPNTNIRNVVDPSRVTRGDQRSDQQQAGDASVSHRVRYESNFLTFLQRMANSPDSASAMLRLLQGQGLQVSSGITAGLAEELKAFLDMLQMDEAQLAKFLQNQLMSGQRFGGALFGALRNAFNSSQSEMFRTEILQFLRQYSDWSSTEHLESRMLRTLYDMTKSLPSHWANQLTDMAAKMENGIAARDRQGNLELLRGQVFPLISDYVRRTHDHGMARGLLSMLTLDIVRYENGAENDLIQAFRHLGNYNIFKADLNGLSDADILRLLKDTEFAKASRSDNFTQRFIELAQRSLQGEGGTAAQDIFRSLMSSILINESVYMPLQHLMLPFQWEDKAVFSEMWVDPDAEHSAGREAPAPRLLIKMDIEGIGPFDLIIDSSTSGKTSMQVSCPQEVAAFSGDVSRDLTDILTRNGLTPGDVRVSAMKRPMNISDAFPNLFQEVKNGVDVKV
ncbi:MAG: hypothetical protein HFE91_03370 [Acutalibacter sp.]|jgi:hypothetical protein|uniref:hypothetical protein n=1 Tax=Acutalibacter sp. TaxID=1918636 RepID=UPI0021744597|nr:hypothetical protein [Acutalibacter sp.]MCI9224491.1 hypothetical protein [Acutalibacter sp.]